MSRIGMALKLSLFVFLLSVFITATGPAFAADNVPTQFLFEGLVRDNTGARITSTTVYVKFEIMGGASCVIYSEKHGPLDLSASNGYVSVAVGSGTLIYGAYSADLFQNKINISGQGPCTITASDGAPRQLKVYYSTDDVSYIALSPNHTISSVPNAAVAESVQGVRLAGLVQVWNSAGSPARPSCDTSHSGMRGYDINSRKFEYCLVGTGWVAETIDPSTLAQGGASANQVLSWNGSAWAPASFSTLGNGLVTNAYLADNSVDYNKLAVGAVSGDRIHQMGAAADYSLKWDGAKWVSYNVQSEFLNTAGDTVTGGLMVNPAGDASLLTLKYSAAQTSYVMDIKDSGGAQKFALDKWGRQYTNGMLSINTEPSKFSTSLGYSAGTNTILENSVAIGYAALKNSSGTENTAVGFNALMSSTAGSYNVAVGGEALESLTNGNANVAVGPFAMNNSDMASQNVALGYGAGQSLINGTSNVFVGHQAGNLNSGNGNIFLGYQAGMNEAGSNRLYIDNSATASPLIFGDFTANTVHINGGLGVSSGISLGGSQISGLGWPTAATQAASKAYSDVFVAGSTVSVSASSQGQVLYWDTAGSGSWKAGTVGVLGYVNTADGDARYVNIASDTLTGTLRVGNGGSLVFDSGSAINLNGTTIQNVGWPSANGDGVSKGYASTYLAGSTILNNASAQGEILKLNAGGQWVAYNIDTALAGKIDRAGDTVNGAFKFSSGSSMNFGFNRLTEIGLPTESADAARRDWVMGVAGDMGGYYVRRTGDTMTGRFVVQGSNTMDSALFITGGKLVIDNFLPKNAALEVKGHIAMVGDEAFLVMASDTGKRGIMFNSGTLDADQRWMFYISDTPETGSRVGSDFAIYSYGDTGGDPRGVFSASRKGDWITLGDPNNSSYNTNIQLAGTVLVAAKGSNSPIMHFTNTSGGYNNWTISGNTETSLNISNWVGGPVITVDEDIGEVRFNGRWVADIADPVVGTDAVSLSYLQNNYLDQTSIQSSYSPTFKRVFVTSNDYWIDPLLAGVSDYSAKKFKTINGADEICNYEANNPPPATPKWIALVSATDASWNPGGYARFRVPRNALRYDVFIKGDPPGPGAWPDRYKTAWSNAYSVEAPFILRDQRGPSWPGDLHYLDNPIDRTYEGTWPLGGGNVWTGTNSGGYASNNCQNFTISLPSDSASIGTRWNTHMRWIESDWNAHLACDQAAAFYCVEL